MTATVVPSSKAERERFVPVRCIELSVTLNRKVRRLLPRLTSWLNARDRRYRIVIFDGAGASLTSPNRQLERFIAFTNRISAPATVYGEARYAPWNCNLACPQHRK